MLNFAYSRNFVKYAFRPVTVFRKLSAEHLPDVCHTHRSCLDDEVVLPCFFVLYVELRVVGVALEPESKEGLPGEEFEVQLYPFFQEVDGFHRGFRTQRKEVVHACGHDHENDETPRIALETVEDHEQDKRDGEDVPER